MNIDFNQQYEGNKLVVFGVLNAEKKISITVSHTVPVIGEVDLDTTVVTDAEVLLIEDQIIVDTLLFNASSKAYSSSIYPKQNKFYALKICASGYPCVKSGVVELPKEISVENIKFVVDGVEPMNQGTGTLLIEVDSRTFDSAPYFTIVADLIYQGQSDISSNMWDLKWEKINEVTDCLGYYDDMIIYTQECIIGQDTIKVGLETDFYLEKDSSFVPAESVKVSIGFLSEDYYKYLTIGSDPEGIDRAFQEGSPLYTNIEGGYGFFGAESTKEYQVVIPH